MSMSESLGAHVGEAGRPRKFQVVIDGQKYGTDDPILTGRQLLDLAEKRPVEEHLVYLLGESNLLEDISLEETVDLRGHGAEQFLTFKSDRSFRFELDSRRQDWGAPKISESTLRKLAGVGEQYRVWLERRGQEDRLLERGEFVALDEPGVERFYTGRDDTTAGRGPLVLPQADSRYLQDRPLDVEGLVDGQQKAIVFKNYPLPAGRYDAERADVLVVLPPGYPDTPPDMFFTDPWLKLTETGQYADRAATEFKFADRRWQRWSRHNNEWRVGIDGIQTMLRRIDRALRGMH